MDITISGRHCDVSDALRERATSLVERLGQIPPHAIEATVVFEFDAGPQLHRVEIRLHVPGRKILIALADGPDHRTALDRAEEKVRHQLDKTGRSKTRPRQAPAPGT